MGGGTAVMSVLGGAANAYGAGEQQIKNNETRRELKRIIDYLGAASGTFRDDLSAGLMPGGQYRDLLAAQGQYDAATSALQGAQQGRQLGSRTSAKARQLMNSVAGGGYTEADALAEIQADRMLTNQMLEQMGYSALLGSKPAENKMAPYAGAIKGAGELYDAYQDGKKKQDESEYATF